MRRRRKQEPFHVKDCTLLSKMSGLRPAFSIRDLRDRLALCDKQVIYHHFCETLLAPSFDYPDFRNDFAVWAKRQLEDNVLAERLGMIDPYAYPAVDDLRRDILDILDERLNEIPVAPSVSSGHEFYFREAITVVFDTGLEVSDPLLLAEAITRMTSGSVYFHFLEARRRTPEGIDDFSLWLREFNGQWDDVLRSLKGIDFVFYSLQELKQEMVRTITTAIKKRKDHGI